MTTSMRCARPVRDCSFAWPGRAPSASPFLHRRPRKRRRHRNRTPAPPTSYSPRGQGRGRCSGETSAEACEPFARRSLCLSVGLGLCVCACAARCRALPGTHWCGCICLLLRLCRLFVCVMPVPCLSGVCSVFSHDQLHAQRKCTAGGCCSRTVTSRVSLLNYTHTDSYRHTHRSAPGLDVRWSGPDPREQAAHVSGAFISSACVCACVCLSMCLCACCRRVALAFTFQNLLWVFIVSVFFRRFPIRPNSTAS